MAVIHLGWLGKKWRISPFFWIEGSSVLKDADIIRLFPIKINISNLNTKKDKNNILLYDTNTPVSKVFEFKIYDILKFFKSLITQDIKNDFSIADDIKYWEVFTKWSLSFLIRQEVIPYLIKTQDGLEARWLPILKESSYRDLIKFINFLSSYKIAKGYNRSQLANILLDICYVLVDSLCRLAAIKKGFKEQVNYSQSIHDLWLYSLLGTNPTLRLQNTVQSLNLLNFSSAIAPKDIDKFYSQIIDWQRPIAEKSSLPFKLIFELDEPISDKEKWTLQSFIQTIDDNLMFPLPVILQDSRHSSLVSKGLVNLKTTILALLSRASKLFPPIKRQLLSPNSPYILLNTQEAYKFLKEGSWLLREEGFGILTPKWWQFNSSIYKLHTKAAVKSDISKDKIFSLNTKVEIECYLAFNGEPLSKEEIANLIVAEKGLIKLRNKWIEIDPNYINEILNYTNKKEKIPILKIIAASLGTTVDINNISIDEIESSGWLKDFLRELKNIKYKKAKISPPKRFNATLRNYQSEGFCWLYFMSKWGLGTCLADDMGLGKTIQVLALIEKYIEQGVKSPFLIIAPTSVIGNWEQEIARFLPHLSCYIHQGVDRVAKEQLVEIIKTTPIIITSYALLTRDFDRLKDINWFAVIVDEAQNIKNPFSKQSKYLRSLKNKVRIALTGTPIENSLSDLWGIMEFLNPGLLGSYEAFRRDFLIPIQLEDDKERLNRLKSLISPFVLRREKTDPSIELNLPEKKEQIVNAFLTKEQIFLYKSMVKEIQTRIDTTNGIAKKGLILSTITKLKQICDHPALFLKDNSIIEKRSGKLEILKSMLSPILSKGESAIIFTQFASMGHILQQHLNEFFNKEVLFIYGGLSRVKRDEIVEYFQRSPQPQILVLSLRASGTGLNLTKATHVFHYDRWWNPAVENQATDRAYRIGQEREVRVYKFICKGTIEEKIEKILHNKLKLAKNLITTGETWITQLSDQELKRLITLDIYDS